MPRKISNYRKVLRLLDELHVKYPSFDIMRHITTATADYGDTWGMNDKELLFTLNKYKSELELDFKNIVSEEYLETIVRDAENLADILNDDVYEEEE